MNRSLSLSLSILPRKSVLDQLDQQQDQVRPGSGSAMNWRVKKCLKRIEKNEEKERKILQRQRKELTKALQETDKHLEGRQKKIDRTTSVEEQKIDDEIQKLSNRLNQLQADKVRLAAYRESELEPLRKQSSDLKEKMRIVDRQLEDVEARNIGQFRRLSSTTETSTTRQSSEIVVEDFSPSSPPPYQP